MVDQTLPEFNRALTSILSRKERRQDRSLWQLRSDVHLAFARPFTANRALLAQITKLLVSITAVMKHSIAPEESRLSFNKSSRHRVLDSASLGPR